jgi:hypothetical protein
MERSHQLESAIYRQLCRVFECSFEKLIGWLPQYSWNAVFNTVDRLSRQGRLALRHPTRFGFQIALRSGAGDAASPLVPLSEIRGVRASWKSQRRLKPMRRSLRALWNALEAAVKWADWTDEEGGWGRKGGGETDGGGLIAGRYVRRRISRAAL